MVAAPPVILYAFTAMAFEIESESLPEHIVRVSPRARHLHLRVTPDEGLIVVTPVGFPKEAIPSVLRSQQAWVQRALARVSQEQRRIVHAGGRPERIDLAAVDRSWSIDWIYQSGVPLTVDTKDGNLLQIRGDVRDARGWPAVLRRWVQREARRHLIPWVHSFASEMDVRFSAVAIRCQKTRWGSCSRRGTISLNAQLLFLPRELVSYVLHHELCHLMHPNHSPAFWKRVEQFEPNMHALRRDLRQALQSVPIWMRTQYDRLALDPDDA